MLRKIESEQEFRDRLSDLFNKIPPKSLISNCVFMPQQVKDMVRQGLYFFDSSSGMFFLAKKEAMYQLYFAMELNGSMTMPHTDLPVAVDFDYSNEIKEKQLTAVKVLKAAGFSELSIARKMQIDLKDIPHKDRAFEIYSADIGDVQEIMKLWNHVFREEENQIKFNEAEVKAYLDRGEIFYVKDEKGIAAAIHCEISRKSCALWHLAVSERCRGMHMGSGLMRYALEYAREAGALSSWLWVETKNTSASSIYENIGFSFTNKYTRRFRF